MAYPSTGTVTLSSSAASAQINLDPTARTTTLMLINNVTSTSTAAAPAFGATVRVELTLDTWLPAGVTQAWQNASSLTYGSSQFDGAFLSILGPVAGARLNSSAFTGSSAAQTGSFTLKSLQSLTAGP